MKKSDISATLNAHLVSAVNEGFAPCLTELTGSYSGVDGNQLVLAKNRERIVMWISRGWTDEHVEVLTANVARFEMAKGESTEWHYCWPEQWAEHLVYSKSYYEVGRHSSWFVETEAEAEAMRDKRHERYAARARKNQMVFENSKKLLSIVRKVSGFKTVKASDIMVYKAPHAAYGNHPATNSYVVKNTKSGNFVTLK